MNWDQYYLDICKTVATNSKCLSRKIGSIIVKDKSIISTGYNGPPRSVPTCNSRWSGQLKDDYLLEISKDVDIQYCDDNQTLTEYMETTCPRRVLGFKSGEGLHICIAGHAERNALINAARHGVSIKDAILYLDTVVPCSPCIVEIINAGIKEVVCTDLKVYDKQAEYLIKHSDVIVRKYEL